MKKLSMFLAAVLLLSFVGPALSTPALALEATAAVVKPSGENGGTVTLTVTGDEPTEAGEIRVSYDSRVLTLLSTDTGTEMCSIHTQKDSILVEYANLEAMTGTLAVFTFSYSENGAARTSITVETSSYTGSDAAKTDTKNLTVVLRETSGGSYQPPVEPQPPAEEHVCPSEAYSDLDNRAWYHEAADYVLERRLMQGVGVGIFQPMSNMTRAQFVTVLGRMAGIDTSAYSGSSFEDVAADSWYGPYVQWAHEAGIAHGVTETLFEPEGAMTREQMVTFLGRYAQAQGIDIKEGAAASFDGFSDGEAVSGWAREAFLWAVGNGVINGTGVGLDPVGMCSRIQVAQAAMNYEQKFL